MVTSGFGAAPEEWVRAGRGFGDGSDLLAAGVDAFCRVVGGQPFGGDELGRALFEGDAKAAGFVQRRDRLLTELSVTVNVLRRMGAGLRASGGRYLEADARIADELGGLAVSVPGSGSSSVVPYRHAPVPGGLPETAPPPGIVREALWVFEAVGFGFAWPDGDPDAVRALQRAVVVLRGVVGEVAGETGGHSRRVTGSGFGAATEAFGADARVVDGVLADLEQWCADLADYCRAAEAAILSAQRHFVASAVFVVGLMYAVSVLGPFMEAGLAVALPLIRLEGLALRIVSRLLYEAVIGTAFSGGLDAIDQAFRPGDFSWKELAGAMGQGALAGGLMGLAHAGLPALGSRSPALAALARLMEAPGARGVMTRFAVGGTIGTTAMATAGAAAGHGWDLKHAAETGFGMAFIGAGTELAGHAFRPAVDASAVEFPADDAWSARYESIADPAMTDHAAGAPRLAEILGDYTEPPGGGGGPAESRRKATPGPLTVSEDGSGIWFVERSSRVRIGTPILRWPELERITALTATGAPAGIVLNVQMRPRFDRPEEFLHIPLDGSPSSPIADATVRADVVLHAPWEAARQLSDAGFHQIDRDGNVEVWKYAPPDGSPPLMVRTVAGYLDGVWRYAHPELSAYISEYPRVLRGRDVVAGPYMEADRTELWQAGALRFGMSGLRPDRITHVEVRPGATADDLRPPPGPHLVEGPVAGGGPFSRTARGFTGVPSAEQARIEPLRVIDRLRELGAFPDGELAEFTWGSDRFRVRATRIEGTAGAPGAEHGYHYEVSRTGRHTRLAFDSADIHDPGAHEPSDITAVFGDHARVPRPDPRTTHATPNGYGLFRDDTSLGADWASAEPLARARAHIDAVVADLSTDPKLGPRERRQRVDELAAIADHADQALNLANHEQLWSAPDVVRDDEPKMLRLQQAADAVLAVHRAVGRYAEAWAHSIRPGALDVADLDPLSHKALASETVHLTTDLRLPVLTQAKIAALAERIYNPDGDRPEFGRHLRRWLVSSVALREDAMRRYMGAEADRFLETLRDRTIDGFVDAQRRWMAVRVDKPLAAVAEHYFHEVVHTVQAPLLALVMRLARSGHEAEVLLGAAVIEGEITPKAVQRALLLAFSEEEMSSWEPVPADAHAVLGVPGPLSSTLDTHASGYLPVLEVRETVRKLLGDGTIPGASWEESYDGAMKAMTRAGAYRPVLGRSDRPGGAGPDRSAAAYVDMPVLYHVMKQRGFPLADPEPGHPSGHLAAIMDLARTATVPDFPSKEAPGPLRRGEAGVAAGELVTLHGDRFRRLGIQDVPTEQILAFHVTDEPAGPAIHVLTTNDLFVVNTADGVWTTGTPETLGQVRQYTHRDDQLTNSGFRRMPYRPDGLTIWRRGRGAGEIIAIYRGPELEGLFQWVAPDSS